MLNSSKYSDIEVLFSITNKLNDEKKDTVKPFSLFEFVNFSKITKTNSNTINEYKNYLQKWNKSIGETISNENNVIKEQFIQLFKEITLKYTTEEEKRYLQNIDFNDEENIFIAVPFFSRKIKEIILYYQDRRKTYTRNYEEIFSKGNKTNVKNYIKSKLIDFFQEDEKNDLSTITNRISSIQKFVEVDIEDSYDIYNDYFDIDPSKPPEFYSSGQTFKNIEFLGEQLQGTTTTTTTPSPPPPPTPPPSSSFWEFDTPSNGDELTVVVESSAEINWGDGNTETLANNTPTTHTYTTGFIPNSFYFSIPGIVTNFTASRSQNPGDAIFGGVINVASLPNLETLQIRGHDLTDVSGITEAENLTRLIIFANALDGDIKQYMPPNIEEIQIQFNPIDQPIPNNTLAEYTALRIIATSGNSNMGGSFPTFSTSIEQIDFGGSGMSGDLPSLTSYTNLNKLWLYSNNFGIPSGWVVPASLTGCLFNSNSLTSTEVDRVLVAFDNAGATDGSLDLRGSNAAPTGTGITAKNSLISKAWTVLTN